VHIFKQPEKEPFALISDEEASVWSIERVPGKWRWIMKNSAVYGVVWFSAYGLYYWLFGLKSYISFGGLFLYVAVGIPVFLFRWDQREYQYKQYLAAKSPDEPPKEAFLQFENE
jgi:hypothetical protein